MSATLDSVETWSGKDRGDENFPVGSALIRAGLRPHVHAYYAFARNADDIADSPALVPADKVARLGRMGAVLREYQPRCVMHFAASSLVGESMSKPGKYWRNNLVQTLDQLGTPQSHGCIRQERDDAIALWDFTEVGTTVVVV